MIQSKTTKLTHLRHKLKLWLGIYVWSKLEQTVVGGSQNGRLIFAYWLHYWLHIPRVLYGLGGSGGNTDITEWNASNMNTCSYCISAKVCNCIRSVGKHRKHIDSCDTSYDSDSSDRSDSRQEQTCLQDFDIISLEKNISRIRWPWHLSLFVNVS